MSPNFPACYVIIRNEDKFLFVFRENTGYMDGYYGLPAGRVEKGEQFSLGAAREAPEEVGITVDPKTLRHVFTLHRNSRQKETSQWIDVFFEADEWKGTPANMEPDKHSKIEWLPISNLPKNIMDYQRHALLEIASGNTYGEFGWEE